MYNVTYTAGVANSNPPADQTVEIGSTALLEWNISGSGGEYFVERNGTLFLEPRNWSGPNALIIVRSINIDKMVPLITPNDPIPRNP